MRITWAVVIVAVALVVFAQARVRRADRSGAASAIGSLSAVARAQSAYATAAGNAGYAASLKTLATPCPGRNEGFVTPDLGSDPATRAGFEIRLRVKTTALRVSSDCNGASTFSSYYATATPVNGTGAAFAVDETGTVWSDASGVAPTPPLREHGSVKRIQ